MRGMSVTHARAPGDARRGGLASTPWASAPWRLWRGGRSAVVLGIGLALAGCSPRHANHPVGPGTLGTIGPPPAPPPGAITVWGPLRIESIVPARSEVGWD